MSSVNGLLKENNCFLQDNLKIADVEGGTDFFAGFKTNYKYSDTWDTIISYLKPKTTVDVKNTVAKVVQREKEEKKVSKWVLVMRKVERLMME